ncbi:MAG: hypothetical protein NVSMB56_15960 [Pyrinomonadaceae bacterium]
MEKLSEIRIEDFGGHVNRVWLELRPTTRRIIERALQSASLSSKNSRAMMKPYDARAEFELSRLLDALDARAIETNALDDSQKKDLHRVAETCAVVLQTEAHSAEVFAQLLERALSVGDFARVDETGEILTTRLAPTELCELARHRIPAVRAIAFEALMQKPTSALIGLLIDPVDSEVARAALEGQAFEYDIEEARRIVNALDEDEMMEDM